MQEKSGLRLIFAGTPTFAAGHLSALLQSKHDVVAVYTQPDRPAGRGKKLTESPVKQLAKTNNLSVLQPPSLKDPDALAALSGFQADLMIVVAYGLILPLTVLETPRLGCLNVHGSLLPRWRGAAPIQRAIEAGDEQTGVTIMQMDEGLDTGDMLATATYDIKPSDTSHTVFDALESLGADCLIKVLDQISAGQPPRRIKQNDELATYASKISKQEALINWANRGSLIERRIRAFNPFPIAYTVLEGQRIKIHRAEILDTKISSDAVPGAIQNVGEAGIEVACSDGIIRLTHIQLPGKKVSAVKDILLGNKSLFNKGKIFDAE